MARARYSLHGAESMRRSRLTRKAKREATFQASNMTPAQYAATEARFAAIAEQKERLRRQKQLVKATLPKTAPSFSRRATAQRFQGGARAGARTTETHGTIEPTNRSPWTQDELSPAERLAAIRRQHRGNQ
jgi:hypothetical protein